MIYVVYYLASGYVTSVKRIQEDMIEANAQPDESWLIVPGPVPATEVYVAKGEILTRPAMELVVSSLSIAPDAVLSITGIPEGATLRHPGGTDTVTGGEVEWSTPVPGVYRFSFENFPYVAEEVSIEVTS